MNYPKIHIAVCSPIEQTWQDRLFELESRTTIIGSGWARSLRDFWDLGEVTTGDKAIKKIRANDWNANHAMIIQSEDSKHGKELERLGCHRLQYFCWESPLYAFRVFDRIRRHGHGYRYASLPQTTSGIELGAKEEVLQPVYFPCLPGRQSSWIQSSSKTFGHEKRQRKAVLIAGYKPLRSEAIRCATEREWQATHLGLITDLRRLKSSTFRQAKAKQTHIFRLQLAKELAKHNLIDIYGNDWPIKNYGRCSSKRETLNDYEFSITMENCIWPGYHTEKLPEVLAAGSIPIAHLDKVTSRTIPEGCYLNISNLDPGAVASMLKNLAGTDIREMQEKGRAYLSRKSSASYFEDDFAESIATKALQLSRELTDIKTIS